MQNIRVAVIGVGYLGKFHAQKYQLVPNCDLIAVIDSCEERAKQVSQELKVPYYLDDASVLDTVDAVSIVSPTTTHFEVAKRFLQHGIHVFVEKPLTSTLEESEELAHLSHEKGVIVQVGHIERFNLAFLSAFKEIQNPQFIEGTRVAHFSPRGTDVDVIFDLMIHDLDLAISLMGQLPSSVEAVGANVLTANTDICNARLKFDTGSTINLTASRIAQKTERKWRIFKTGTCVNLDLALGKATQFQVQNQEVAIEDLVCERTQSQLLTEQHDALLEEILDFVNCIQNLTPPIVGATEAVQAIKLAVEIKNQLK